MSESSPSTSCESRLIGRQNVRLAAIESRDTGSGSVGGSQSTLPANVSQTLDVIYNAYEQNPGGFPANLPATDGANTVVIQGNNVGIQVHDGNPADFNNLLIDLQNDGMQVTLSSARKVRSSACCQSPSFQPLRHFRRCRASPQRCGRS